MLLKSLIQKEHALDSDRRSIVGSVTKSPMNRFESKQEIREPGQKASIDEKYFTKSQPGGILDQSKVNSIQSSGRLDKHNRVSKIESIMQDRNESDHEEPIN